MTETDSRFIPYVELQERALASDTDEPAPRCGACPRPLSETAVTVWPRAVAAVRQVRRELPRPHWEFGLRVHPDCVDPARHRLDDATVPSDERAADVAANYEFAGSLRACDWCGYQVGSEAVWARQWETRRSRSVVNAPVFALCLKLLPRHRRRRPGQAVMVHPECFDATSYTRYVADASPGHRPGPGGMIAYPR